MGFNVVKDKMRQEEKRMLAKYAEATRGGGDLIGGLFWGFVDELMMIVEILPLKMIRNDNKLFYNQLFDLRSKKNKTFVHNAFFLYEN